MIYNKAKQILTSCSVQ